MMKTVRHNRKELKHIENSLKRNSVNKPVKVNNFLFMDNQERFENVCLGYSIQAERLMNIVQQSTAGTITKDWVTPERKTAIEQSSVLMEMIQLQLLKLKEANGKYQKHIKNSIYCQQLLRSYISKLQKIITEVDALVGTGGHSMNGNIEVVNENLWCVNQHYVHAGYIKELTLLPGTHHRLLFRIAPRSMKTIHILSIQTAMKWLQVLPEWMKRSRLLTRCRI